MKRLLCHINTTVSADCPAQLWWTSHCM